MKIRETHCNASENYQIGTREPYRIDADRGTVFRDMQREHGRCKGKVYVDVAEMQDIEPRTESLRRSACRVEQVGWVFEKRQQYSDSSETYLHETWVSWK